MALFTFISGYFFKDSNSKKFIKKKTKRLIGIYIIWNIIYGLVIYILKQIGLINYGGKFTLYNIFIAPFTTSSNQFNFNSPAWFVISIYFVQLIYFFVNKVNKKLHINTKYIVLILSTIIATVELKFVVKGYNNGIWFLITRICFLMPFYCFGQVYKKFEKYDKLNNTIYFITLLIVQTILLQKFKDLTYNLNTLSFKHSYIIYMMSSITGTMFWLRISAILEKYIGDNKIINYIGNNTYEIMMHHLFIFFIVNTMIYYVNKITGLLGKFDINSYKKSVWYVYDKENSALLFLYVILGISIPLLIKYYFVKRKKLYKKRRKNMKYDYLIVGTGLFGSIFAHEANKKGKKCLVIDKRSHIAGNIYTENKEGINVHKYGAHIFHTSNKEVWQYINQFAEFNRYTNSPVARYKDELYNMPFNMNTFNKLWGVITPKQAKQKIEEEKKEAGITDPKNLEEQAISLVGKTIYEKLVKGYTEKQWGQRATELPSFIIKRLPVRFIYDNNYFNDIYQGIPIGGYTQIIEKMLEGIEVRLNCDFFDNREELENIAEKIVFTGPIDKFYDYKFGELEYRSLRFETETLDESNYQGNAVVNYTEYEIPYTRIIEHKHFEYGQSLGKLPEGEAENKTIITREYPDSWNKEKEPYYPINNEKNNNLYEKYKEYSKKDSNVIFGGRLGQYKYYDMDKVIAEALKCVQENL